MVLLEPITNTKEIIPKIYLHLIEIDIRLASGLKIRVAIRVTIEQNMDESKKTM